MVVYQVFLFGSYTTFNSEIYFVYSFYHLELASR